MLELAHSLKVVETAFFKSGKLDHLAHKKVLRQVNGRLQTANKTALHRTVFELP